MVIRSKIGDKNKYPFIELFFCGTIFPFPWTMLPALFSGIIREGVLYAIRPLSVQP